MTAAIYMDYSATTPCDPRVVERMLPYFRERFGNPASKSHAHGWEADAAVEEAREQVAALIGAHPREIVWTSGATEANNLALKGAAELYRPRGQHIVTCATEHRAVLDPVRRLEQQGFEVTVLPVDGKGRIDLGALEAAITGDTFLISLMAANNETGTVHPVAEVGRLAKERGVLLHCDATQAPGRMAIDVQAWGVDLLSLSAHKFYGPKGIGCLYVRRRGPRVRLAPLLDGGGHEQGMRSGTLNVPALVGMGEAARILREEDEVARLAELRDGLEAGILGGVPDAVVHGDREGRLPHVCSIGFPGIEGGELMAALRDLAVSAGSACTSARPEPSHVLKAMGISDDLSRGSLRLSLGRFTTPEEVTRAARRVGEEVARLRAPAGVPFPAGEDALREGHP